MSENILLEKKLSIVIPVFNEPENIGLTIKMLEAVLEFEHEILIVYDDERDTTIEPVKKYFSTFSNIFLLKNKFGSGALNAVMTGIDNSRYDIILMTVVDDVIPIVSINEMIEMILNRDYDLVTATRYSKGGKRYGGSLVGGLLSRFANFFLQKFTGFIISDFTTGIKMIKRNVWYKFDLVSNPIGWSFSFELAIKAQLFGHKVGEVPVISVDRILGGQSTFQLGTWVREYSRWFVWAFLSYYKFKIFEFDDKNSQGNKLF